MTKLIIIHVIKVKVTQSSQPERIRPCLPEMTLNEMTKFDMQGLNLKTISVKKPLKEV